MVAGTSIGEKGVGKSLACKLEAITGLTGSAHTPLRYTIDAGIVLGGNYDGGECSVRRKELIEYRVEVAKRRWQGYQVKPVLL